MAFPLGFAVAPPVGAAASRQRGAAAAVSRLRSSAFARPVRLGRASPPWWARAGRQAGGAGPLAAPPPSSPSPLARPAAAVPITASSSSSLPPPSPSPASGGGGSTTTSLLGALYKFTRPHTIRGTILGAISGATRAVLESRAPIDWRLLPVAALGVVALLCGNAFIVGINQIYDVNIDVINKPFLPIAAGELSIPVAWAFILGSAVSGLAIVKTYFSNLILGLYSLGLVVGALYSTPGTRLKRFPIAAAATIACVRGFLLNFGVYHATMAALGVPFVWSPPITFLAVFMTIYAVVIALAKDLPDVAGDVQYGVSTFASRLGVARACQVVAGLMGANYLMAVVVALAAPAGSLRRGVCGVAHAVLGAVLAWRYRQLDPSDAGSVKRFYNRDVWGLFYAEYALFPFV